MSLCSPRDPSSIVDMYCDDEFALSLEFHPNMLLYPVQGVTSMEAELGKIDGKAANSLQNICSDNPSFPGSFLSMSLNSTHSSLVSNSGEEEEEDVVSVLSVSPQNSWARNLLGNQIPGQQHQRPGRPNTWSADDRSRSYKLPTLWSTLPINDWSLSDHCSNHDHELPSKLAISDIFRCLVKMVSDHE